MKKCSQNKCEKLEVVRGENPSPFSQGWDLAQQLRRQQQRQDELLSVNTLEQDAQHGRNTPTHTHIFINHTLNLYNSEMMLPDGNASLNRTQHLVPCFDLFPQCCLVRNVLKCQLWQTKLEIWEQFIKIQKKTSIATVKHHHDKPNVYKTRHFSPQFSCHVEVPRRRDPCQCYQI